MRSRQGFASAQDVHAQLRAEGDPIGLATVYRTLQALWLDGEIDMLRTDAGEAVYRRCDMDKHHHHLVCRRCGRTVEIEGPGVGPWAEHVSAEHGFTQVSHQLELFGVCPACAEPAGPAEPTEPAGPAEPAEPAGPPDPVTRRT